MTTERAFADIVAMVTGAASGIGRRTAERLTQCGAQVIGCDIAPSTSQETFASWRHLDVTREGEWEAAVASAVAQFGKIDALVNCAGIIVMSNIVDMPLDAFRRIMAINVEGTFLGIKHVMKVMLEAGCGSIVNLSSTAGIAGSPGASAYCASKAAVRLLSKSAALEAIAAGTRVRVNSLHPALTQTPMADDIARQLGDTAEVRRQLNEMHPSGRLADVDEVVDTILFLLSDSSRFINGAELVVDNGFTAQ